MFILGFIIGGMATLIATQFLKQYSIIKKDGSNEE